METTVRADQLYKLSEVAEHLRRHVNTVKNWAATGRIDAVKIGNAWRVKGAEIERLNNGGGLRPAPDREAERGAAEDAADTALIEERLRTSDPSQWITLDEARRRRAELRKI